MFCGWEHKSPSFLTITLNSETRAVVGHFFPLVFAKPDPKTSFLVILPVCTHQVKHTCTTNWKHLTRWHDKFSLAVLFSLVKAGTVHTKSTAVMISVAFFLLFLLVQGKVTGYNYSQNNRCQWACKCTPDKTETGVQVRCLEEHQPWRRIPRLPQNTTFLEMQHANFTVMRSGAFFFRKMQQR